MSQKEKFLKAFGSNPVAMKALRFMRFQDEVTEVPEVIHHYCPTQSFLAILKSKEIWGTHHSMTNDSLEAIWFVSVLIKEAEIRYRGKNTDEITKFIRTVELNLADYFIASFSSEKDSLSQWRNYAADGTGFCIAFRSESFGAKPHYPTLSEIDDNRGIIPVDYSDPKSSVDDLLDLFDQGFYRDASPSLHHLCYGLKHQSFKDEKEIRLVEVQKLDMLRNPDCPSLRTLAPGSHLCYRSNFAGDIVPYRRFACREGGDFMHVDSIGIGPRNRTNPQTLSLLLEKENIVTDHGIWFSESSYVG